MFELQVTWLIWDAQPYNYLSLLSNCVQSKGMFSTLYNYSLLYPYTLEYMNTNIAKNNYYQDRSYMRFVYLH